MVDGSRANDLKLGIFVLVALALIVVSLLWVVGSSIFVGPSTTYRVLLRDSGGVAAGDRVRLAGVPIGRVQTLELHPAAEWPVILEISVRQEIPLYQDASATIANTGILGTNFLQIDPGHSDLPRLEEGSDIEAEAAMGLETAMEQVQQIGDKMSGILDQTSTLLDQVSSQIDPILAGLQAMLSEQNVEEIGALLAGFRETTDEISPRIGPLLDQLSELSTSLGEGLEDMPEIADRLNGLVDQLSSALGPDGQRLSDLLTTTQDTLVSAGNALSVIEENRGGIEATMRDLQETAANFKSFSRQINERPSSLIRSSRPRPRAPGEGAP